MTRTAGVLVAAALVIPGPAQAAGRHKPKPPTKAQIRAAIDRAVRSRDLWATVNICNTKRHPHTIGIRGQMPSLSFPSTLSMKVQVDYWSSSTKRFVPDPGVSTTIPLGDPTNELIQGGATFKFTPPVLLSGSISYEWKLGRRVIGRASKTAGHGYKHVDYGDPSGYSAATCRMH